MPLTDPELDLLLELLDDSPEEDVFVQVGEELNRRARWDESYAVLRRGLQHNMDETEGWSHLARSALEVGEYSTALSAWERSGVYQGALQMGHIRVLALERAGRVDEAREAIDAFELLHGAQDVVVESARERLDAPPPDRTRSADDPFLTVAHAERYAAVGRHDRAIRVYHRILHRYPDDLAIKARLDQLQNGTGFDADDFTDLSEELIDPSIVPPDLVMPTPQITSASVEPAPGRADRPTASGSRPPGLEAFLSSSKAAHRTGKPRRRRRSLLKR